MNKPVRFQLSRKKGFDLQAISLAANGLRAVNVARPSKWGNPFLVHPHQKPGRIWGASQYVSVPTAEDAVAVYREMLTLDGRCPETLRRDMPEIRGKHLACWCKLGEPCHADVLLEIANAD